MGSTSMFEYLVFFVAACFLMMLAVACFVTIILWPVGERLFKLAAEMLSEV